MKYWRVLSRNIIDGYGGGEDYDHLIIFQGEKEPERCITSVRFDPNKENKPFIFKNKTWKKFHSTSQYGRSAESVGPENKITEKEVKEIIDKGKGF